MTSPLEMFGGLAPAAPVDAPRSAEEAGRQFEVMMAEMLIKEMRKAMPEDSLFSSGELATFTEMLDHELALRLTEGPGLGLKARIAEHLEALGERPGRPRSVDGRLPVRGVVTSHFGPRRDPLTGRSDHHPGVDIAAPRGSPVRAVKDGVVRWAGQVEGYGRVVYLDHGDGLETRYAHCETLKVRAGQQVEAGERIATVGSSGRSTGPHLHLEARQEGVPVDPEAVFSWKSSDPPQGFSR